jgi:hypothetical protein
MPVILTTDEECAIGAAALRHGFNWIGIVGASAFADQALMDRAAGASQPSGIDSSRKNSPSFDRAELKNRTFIQQLPAHRVRSYLTRTATKDISDPLETFRTRRRQSLSRGYDYFFFLEVFFATFLAAAFAVFFAFFAFLAMSSSEKKPVH